jgi:hypothetical protein
MGGGKTLPRSDLRDIATNSINMHSRFKTQIFKNKKVLIVFTKPNLKYIFLHFSVFLIYIWSIIVELIFFFNITILAPREFLL